MVATSKAERSGISFAVPAREVARLLEEAKKHKTGQYPLVVSRPIPWLGMAFGSPERSGAIEIDVMKRGPAEKAGLKDGDRLLAIDGQQVHAGGQVLRMIRNRKIGDKVTVRYQRGTAEPAEVAVELAAAPHLKEQADSRLTDYTIQSLPSAGTVVLDPQTQRIIGVQRAGLAPSSLTVTRSGQEVKLEQLSKQMDEISKRLQQLADEVRALREAKPQDSKSKP